MTLYIPDTVYLKSFSPKSKVSQIYFISVHICTVILRSPRSSKYCCKSAALLEIYKNLIVLQLLH